MCTCTSCSTTDALAGWKEVRGRRVADPKSGGWENWPRGNPAGRRAAAEYAAHVSHGRSGIAHGWRFEPGAPAAFPAWTRGAPRLPYPSALVAEFIAGSYKKTGQAEAQPASPAAPCKAPQHFRELDRQPAACKIYTMKKSSRKTGQKLGRGRPPIPGRRVVIKLEERHIKRAMELGDSVIAEGIRKALSR